MQGITLAVCSIPDVERFPASQFWLPQSTQLQNRLSAGDELDVRANHRLVARSDFYRWKNAKKHKNPENYKSKNNIGKKQKKLENEKKWKKRTSFRCTP